MGYTLFPAVDDATYLFPSEIRQALAGSPELRNTVVPMTTTQRNNLSGAALWDGRVIYNSTTRRLNRYDANATPTPVWTIVAELSDIPTVPPIPVLTDLLATTGLPAVESGSGSLGTSNKAARADHVHPQSLVGVAPFGAVWDASIIAGLGVSQASGLKYLNGQFILMNPQGTNCLRSTDAVTWAISGYPNIANKASVAYGNGVFVGVNTLSGVAPAAVSSDDGATWTAVPSAPVQPWVDVTFGNGLFVAVAGNGTSTSTLMTSANGTSWTTRTLPVSRVWKKVFYKESYGFFALAESTAQVAFSTDGLTWSEVTFSGAPMDAVAHQGRLAMIRDLSGTPTDFLNISSDNGSTWDLIQLPKVAIWKKVISTGLHFAALSSTGDVAVAKNANNNDYSFTLRNCAILDATLIAGSNTRLVTACITAYPAISYSL